MTALILIGPSGTGKTAIVEELESLGWKSADVDHAVARICGVHIDDLHLDVAPAERIELEREVVNALLDDIEADNHSRFAIALPSSVLGYLDDGDQAGVRVRISAAAQSGTATVIQLEAELGKLVMRNGLVGVRSSNVVLPRKELRAHIERYQPTYDALAGERIDTSTESAQQIATRLNHRFGA